MCHFFRFLVKSTLSECFVCLRLGVPPSLLQQSVAGMSGYLSIYIPLFTHSNKMLDFRNKLTKNEMKIDFMKSVLVQFPKMFTGNELQKLKHYFSLN